MACLGQRQVRHRRQRSPGEANGRLRIRGEREEEEEEERESVTHIHQKNVRGMLPIHTSPSRHLEPPSPEHKELPEALIHTLRDCVRKRINFRLTLQMTFYTHRVVHTHTLVCVGL